MHHPYTVILNPTAGKGRARAAVPVIRKFFAAHRIPYTLVFTEYPGHAAELAAVCIEQSSCTVIAAGGDGTCNEVVNGLLSVPAFSPPVFGILPVGSGNDFSFSTGLPMKLKESLELLLDGTTKQVDAGVLEIDDLEPRYFINGMGIGFDALVTYEAGKARLLHGSAGYIYGAIKTLLRFPRPPKVELITDTATHTREPGLISCMLGKRLGGAFLMAPQGDNQDGLFDVAFTEQFSRWLMIRDLLKYKAGKNSELEDTWRYRTTVLAVRALSGEVAVHIDGETVSTTGKQLRAKCLPGALRVIS